MILHLTLRIGDQDDGGIVPISAVDNEPDLLTRLEAEFERFCDDRATDRLAEVDQLFDSQTADEEVYSNLREWLVEDFFDYISRNSIEPRSCGDSPPAASFPIQKEKASPVWSTTTSLIRPSSTASRTAISNRRKPSFENKAVPRTAVGSTIHCLLAKRKLPSKSTTAVSAASNRSVSSKSDSLNCPNPHLVTGPLKTNRLQRTPSNL